MYPTNLSKLIIQDFSLQDGEMLLQFIQQTRAILDSKFNEYTHFEDYRQSSRFPEFVFSWLNTFEYSKHFKIQAARVFDEHKYFTYYKFVEKVADQLWVLS